MDYLQNVHIVLQDQACDHLDQLVKIMHQKQIISEDCDEPQLMALEILFARLRALAINNYLDAQKEDLDYFRTLIGKTEARIAQQKTLNDMLEIKELKTITGQELLNLESHYQNLYVGYDDLIEEEKDWLKLLYDVIHQLEEERDFYLSRMHQNAIIKDLILRLHLIYDEYIEYQKRTEKDMEPAWIYRILEFYNFTGHDNAEKDIQLRYIKDVIRTGKSIIHRRIKPESEHFQLMADEAVLEESNIKLVNFFKNLIQSIDEKIKPSDSQQREVERTTLRKVTSFLHESFDSDFVMRIVRK